jgi:tetratricopeptide (TPR) repeat protein
MPRTACALAALAAVLVAATPVRPAAQAPSRVDALLARYVAGQERNVIAAAFPDHFTFLDWRVELFTRAREWRDSWHPAGATLLLEISFWGFRQSWPDALLILRTAEEIVTGRAAAPGAEPAQDRFEITFHRTALAWLIGARSLNDAQEYMGRLEGRLVAAAAIGAADGRLRDPRVALGRGVLDDAWTAPGALAPASRTDDLPSLTLDVEDREDRAHLDRALAAYVEAGAFPAVSEEAAVRRAFALHRLGRNEEALAALEDRGGADTDPIVRYWRHLFRGRVHEALGRPAQAAAAYRAAGDSWRGAQTPAVALAALFQRQGQAADARRWARVAGTTPASVVDPWWQYWSGDLRFVSDWLSELRRSVP